MSDLPVVSPEAQNIYDGMKPDLLFDGFDHLKVTDFTCCDCSLVSTCDLAFDLYNTNGDCLAAK